MKKAQPITNGIRTLTPDPRPAAASVTRGTGGLRDGSASVNDWAPRQRVAL
jgi:hypothetical protein